jgi:hypothetical protein
MGIMGLLNAKVSFMVRLNVDLSVLFSASLDDALAEVTRVDLHWELLLVSP